MVQSWSSPRETSVHINYKVNDEQLIQTQGGYSDVPPVVYQKKILHPFSTSPDDLSCTPPFFVQIPLLDATCTLEAGEPNDLALEYHNTLSQYTDSDFQDQFLFTSIGNESPQAGYCQDLCQLSNQEADLPTTRPLIDVLPQSSIEPSGHISSQNFTDINPQDPFQFLSGENKHLQPGNISWHSPSGAVDSTSWLAIDSSTQPHAGPSATRHLSSQDLMNVNLQDISWFPFGRSEHLSNQVLRPLLIPACGTACPPTSSTTTIASSAQSTVYVAAEDDLRTVGSAQIRQAAVRRRKKNGTHRCPYCSSTFTELHNLRYHKNSHEGKKPYKCRRCEFAAASPATLKRHMKRHQSSFKEGIGHTIEGTCELKSFSVP